MLFDNAFVRPCIIMLNKTGAIIEPCGIPIIFNFVFVFCLFVCFLLDEYVLPTRVQMHLSDKKFLKY